MAYHDPESAAKINYKAVHPIGLQLVEFRGCYGKKDEIYGPENLLIAGKEDYYWSDYSKPPNEDWITFEVTESNAVPTQIGIWNSGQKMANNEQYFTRSIKSVDILAGPEKEREKMTKWFTVKDIDKGDDAMQFFEIPKGKSKAVAKNKWLFFRVEITGNHGNDFMNYFHEFQILGTSTGKM